MDATAAKHQPLEWTGVKVSRDTLADLRRVAVDMAVQEQRPLSVHAAIRRLIENWRATATAANG